MKKRNKRLLKTILALTLLFGITCGCTGCIGIYKAPFDLVKHAAKKDKPKDKTAPTTSHKDTKKDTQKEKADELKDTLKNELSKSTKTKSIGSEEFGYIEIPENFVRFKDVDGGDDLQYSDPTGVNIFTMNVIKGNVNLDEGAKNLLGTLTEQGMKDGTGANVTVGMAAQPAKQVYGFYEDENKFLVIWLIPDRKDTETTYYLACEFTAEQADLVKCADTWVEP